jgi:hypothetical protein
MQDHDAGAKGLAIDALDDVSRALKRGLEATSWALREVHAQALEAPELVTALKRQFESTKAALREVRRTQATTAGIRVDAPVPEIHRARAALAASQDNTQPNQGGQSVSRSNTHQEGSTEGGARAAG